jgi:DNA-binding NarL/FixJ family response regulator
MRVVIADDSTIVREGIAALLGRAGVDVAAQASSAEELLREVAEHEPDVAIVDIRMPPTFTDEGLRAAHEIRARHPRTGIVILSQHVETGTATRLLAESPERLGYLLKDRVGDVEEFAGTLRRVAAGGSALDPEIVSRLLAGPPPDGPLASLSAREHEVLVLVAEGRSNKAIGERLELSQRGVQKHVTAVFVKLGLTSDEDDNRRILAVLEYLDGSKRSVSASGR